jgi:glycosyltransferase involved in cell wall biosynthesis
MTVTIILCTYNRCHLLAKALESLSVQTLPPDEWEVLIVDNNSTDLTRAVSEDFCRRYPSSFRYLFEAQQGKSYALNAGIREARGAILAFVDDDVIVDSMWLQNLTEAMDNEPWQGAGGCILPQLDFSPPPWLAIEERYALAPLAMFQLGNDARELTEPPFGTNMAFRKEMFEKYGSFRTDLGPRPGCEIRSEDTEFGARLLAAGERLRYEPSARVYHGVPAHRLKKAYFLAWWFDKARADIRAFGFPGETKWRLRGIPLVLFRRLSVWTLRWLVTVKPSQRFSSKLKVWIVAGQILECYRQPRGHGNT